MEEKVLPAGWVRETLGNVLESIVGGGTPDKGVPENFQGDIPLMTVKDMKVTRPSATGFNITEEALANSSSKLVPADTVVIATRMGLGKVVRPIMPTAINQDLKALFPSEVTDKSFLEQWLVSIASKIEAMGTGTTVKGVRLNQIRELEIPLAPLNEQRRIVEKIETLFARIDQGEADLRQVQTLLARYRQSVLKAAVTGQLTADWRAENAHRLEHGRDLLARILKTRRETWQGRGKYKEPAEPDTEDFPELPEGWTWANLDGLADQVPYAIVDGPFGSKLKTSHYTNHGVRVIRLENIGDGIFVDKKSYISEAHADELERHLIAPGDLVIASLGQQLPKACIIPSSVGRAIVKADCIRFSPYRASVNARFILAWLNSRVIRTRVENSIRGVGRPRLNLSDIRGLPVPLPSKEEQDEVARIVAAADEQISRLEGLCGTELTRSTALRQSILKQAFAGRLVPQNPNDEPASELLARIKQASASSAGTTKRTARV